MSTTVTHETNVANRNSRWRDLGCCNVHPIGAPVTHTRARTQSIAFLIPRPRSSDDATGGDHSRGARSTRSFCLLLFSIASELFGFSFIFRSDRFTSARPSRKPVRGCIAAFPFNTRMSVAGVIFFTGVRCRSTRRSAGKLQRAPAAVEDSEIVCRRTHVAHYTLSSSARRTRRVFVYCTLYTRPHTPLGTSPAPPPTPVDPTFGAPRNPKFRRCRGVQ